MLTPRHSLNVFSETRPSRMLELVEASKSLLQILIETDVLHPFTKTAYPALANQLTRLLSGLRKAPFGATHLLSDNYPS